MTYQEEIRMLAENRILQKRRFRRFLIFTILFNCLLWFVVLENEPEAIGVAATLTGISFGLLGMFSNKAFRHPDIEKIKRSRRERKIQKEIAKIEEERENIAVSDYRHHERLRLKEMAYRYPESDFV